MKTMMAICVAALAVCGTLSAQYGNTVDRLTVHFSTPVEVGTTMIPAGDCTLQVVRGLSDNVILVTHPETGAVVTVMVNRMNYMDSDVDTGKGGQVILNRHGDVLRLERILLPDHTGFEILPKL